MPPQQAYGAPPPQGYAAPPPGMPPAGYAMSAPVMGAAPVVGVAVAAQPLLRVRVIKAQHLASADPNGKSDPYVILRWEGQPRMYTKQEGKVDAKVNKAAKKGKVPRPQTSVQKATLNPVWNQVRRSVSSLFLFFLLTLSSFLF